MPPAVCLNCLHWHRKTNHSARTDGATGECRRLPPARDFAWPRTREDDHCGSHQTRAQAAGDAAAGAVEQLSLGQQPDPSAPSLGVEVKAQEGRAADNRPRRPRGQA